MSEEETISRMLPVTMTSEDKLTTGRKIADLEQEIDAFESEKSATNKRFTDTIKGRRQEVRDLSKQLILGESDKPIECRWELNLPIVGKKTLFRVDIAEKVSVEDMELFDTEENEEERPEA